MRKNIALILVGLVLAVSVAPISFAQDDPGCDLQQVRTEFLESIEAAQDWTELATILIEFQSIVATCNGGYTWSGYSDGSLGPVELDEGTYILEYEATADKGEVFNYFNVHLVGVTDDGESDEYIIDHDFPGDESLEGEIVEASGSAVLRLNGGMYLFQVDVLNYQDWSFRLYKVD